MVNSTRQSTYTIRVYDRDGQLLRILSRIKSGRYRLAENEVGDFDISVPWSEDLATLLSPPNHVEFWRDNLYVFGGIIRRQSISQSTRTPVYTVSGPSYMQWLSDTRMRPSTGTADIDYVSAPLDDTIKEIVRVQALDTNSRFTVMGNTSDSAVTDVYTSTAYETVLETLQALATRAEDTTFDIVRDPNTRQLTFKTYTPSRGADRSLGTQSPVLFDMRGGNLLNAEWVRDGNSVVNALWGGGPGDKAARYVWPATEALLDTDSMYTWGRIEGFFDAGSETTTNVQKKTQEELKKLSVPEEYVNFQLTNAGRYTLGVDFDFGTKVTVVWSPILQFSDTIRGLEVRLDEGSSVVGVDINVGDTITGSAQTKASILFGRFLRGMRRAISVQTRH